MTSLFARRQESPFRPSSIVTAGGAIAGLAYAIVAMTAVIPLRGPDRVVEFTLLGLPAIGLLYTGYWLESENLRPSEVWHVGFVSVSGVCIAAVTTGVLAAIFAPPDLSVSATFFLFISTSSEGALLGAFLGVLNTSAFESSDNATVERLTTLNSVLRHDIRNRLTTLDGYVTLIAESDGTPEEDLLEKIEAQQSAIMELLEDAKIAAEAARNDERRPVLLDEVVAEQVELFEATHESVSIDVDVPENTAILADDLLASVVENLLENAVVHTDRDDPEIEIRAEVTDDTVRLVVADDGPGIPDEKKADVFEPEVGDGTGMGLYLVETVVSSYGGDVDVGDNDPRGAAITLTFDRARTVGETERAPLTGSGLLEELLPR